MNQLIVLLGVVLLGAIGAYVESRWPTALDRIALTVFPGLEGSTRYEEKR